MNEEKCGECVATGNTSMTNENLACEDTTKLVGIYGPKNKLKPDKWNIGQSWDVSRRWNSYRLFRCKNQRKFYTALLKYGYDGFEKIILEKLKNPTQQLLDEREDYWIKHYNSIENGYNIKEAGSHGHHSEETKRKMSESHRGKTRPPEVRLKISNTLKTGNHPGRGKHLSKEVKEKISDSLSGNKSYWFGKTLPKEMREKISNSRIGTKNWNFGKHRTNDTKLKMSLAQLGEKNHRFGKSWGEEERKKRMLGIVARKLAKNEKLASSK
jgi:group I intron endonuclease